MALIKVTPLPRDYTRGFERIPNDAIRNPDLSLAAIGLLARLLADGKAFSTIDEIADHYAGDSAERKRGFGRDAYRNAARELEDAGHLIRSKTRGAKGLISTQVRVSAIPEGRVPRPATAQPSPARPGETPGPLSQSDDGSAVSGPNSTDAPFLQVAPTTAQPSPGSPAKTIVPAGRTDDGSAVVFLTDLFTDPDLPPTPQRPAASTGHSAERAGAGEAARNHEPHPDAVAILDKIELNRQPGKTERAELLTLITAALIAGWTIPDLVANLNRDWTGANDRVRTLLYRARDLDEPPPPAQARTPPPPDWCGQCDPRTRRIEDADQPYPCPHCHPNTQTQKAA